MPYQQGKGMTVVASFLDEENGDGYVWMRRFENEDDRITRYAATYEESEWSDVIQPPARRAQPAHPGAHRRHPRTPHAHLRVSTERTVHERCHRHHHCVRTVHQPRRGSRLIGVAPEAAVGQDVSLAIAVTDAGHLCAFEAMDGAPFLGHTVAVDKAGTAAAHRTVVGAALTQLGFTAA